MKVFEDYVSDINEQVSILEFFKCTNTFIQQYDMYSDSPVIIHKGVVLYLMVKIPPFPKSRIGMCITLLYFWTLPIEKKVQFQK
ncbi:hypothetical protein ASG65_05415 [Bacillus sp. Leaf13]|nr:hypothetical protein ASG65_05415 [Bacillus sp. Leaf13]